MDSKINVIVYDSNMKKLAFLENAYNIGYEQKHNELWTAQFTLPSDDEKNVYCEPFNFVEIYDAGERVELFRIAPSTLQKEDISDTTYVCEHVLVTLMDDVLFQYHQIGDNGIYTSTVINYVLSKQSAPRWKLGTNEFSRQFQYSWENENLLAALFSIPRTFLEDYSWTYDTTTSPWTINLVRVSETVQSYVRYKKNMHGIARVVDPSEICTRLYCLGYGEGVNQLNIASLNNGKPYLDAATISKYGIIARVFVDRRFESEETLMARGQVLLQELQIPRVSYSVSAADLYQLTDDPMDIFIVGTHVRIIDTELDINVKALIVSRRKSDIVNNPGDVEIEIANKPLDISSSISDLADRTRINEVYAQGATNYDSHNFADNCDPTHPAILRFWIPEETVRVNKVMLSYRVEAFRGYSKSIEAAPSVSAGPSTKTTAGPSSTATAGPSTKTTAGPSTVTTTSQSSSTTTGPRNVSGSTQTEGTYIGAGGHNHAVPANTRLAVYGTNNTVNGYVTWVPSGNHSHPITLSSHEHDMQHTHNIEHTHNMEHTHDMQHTHNMEHTHEIPAHTHGIAFGIFEGQTPSAVQVRVDGNLITGLGTSVDEIDIVPYLSKDNSGRINRGAFHEITITPVNSLGRVVASVFTQLFAQSRGGGDY